MSEDNKEWDPQALLQVNKILLLAVIIIFHFFLIFHENTVRLFSRVFYGNIFIAVTLVFLFIFLYFAIKKSWFAAGKLEQIVRNVQKYDRQKGIHLFLFLMVPISIFEICLRMFLILRIQIDIAIADMLPLIQKATGAFLVGENPYQIYNFSNTLPLTFWPGLWLIFTPAAMFDFDLRWIGLGIWVIISFILIFSPITRVKKGGSIWILLLSSISVLLLQISFPFTFFQAYGHTFGIWLLLILLGLAIIKKSYVWSAILLGLVLSSRQTAIIFLPALFFFWLHELGWKNALRNLCIAGTIFALIVLPFLVLSPTQFLLAPIQHYLKLGNNAMSLGENGGTAHAIGFSYIIQKMAGPEMLSIISGVVTLFIAVGSFFLRKKSFHLLIYMGFSVTFFSFFTPIPWLYEYFPALLLLTIALFSEE